MVKNMKLGCARSEIKVPLFAEMLGYGRFLGRRNRGSNDPLHCTASSFFDGTKRTIIISNDLCLINTEYARIIRKETAKRLNIDEKAVMVAATHTHSAPAADKTVGWGEIHPECLKEWIELAIETAEKATNDETKVKAFAGICPLKEKLGYNRVKENGPTDTEIRWMKFVKEDGKSKLIIHNHGMHAVVFGPKMLKTSADWPGAANQNILEKGLAENAIFLQGACGDINTEPTARSFEEGEEHRLKIGKSYAESLAEGLDKGEKINLDSLDFSMETEEYPTVEMSPRFLRESAPFFREKDSYLADRLEELAIFFENGGSGKVEGDQQVIRLGDAYIYATPGEVFYGIGQDVLNGSPGKFAMFSEVTNGSCGYMPTPETFDNNPEFLTEKRGYGYYETHFVGLLLFHFNFTKEIGPFLTDKLLKQASKVG
jgi:hypothetical protein